MGEKTLSDRKKKILQAVVDSYITSVEPISSNNIQDKYLPDVSSATIRSELATLEDLGFLIQPHVSSGRVPSSKAYRYYVDNFIGEDDLDTEQLMESINQRFANVEEIVRDGAKVVSDITNYTSMLMITSADNISIKDIKLVDLLDGTALVLIITDSGIIKNKQISIESVGENSNYIQVANGLLARSFVGKKLADVVNNDSILDKELQAFQSIYNDVIDLIIDYKRSREGEVFVEGQNKIFNYPECQDLDNVKNFMAIVNHKEKLHDLMSEDGDIEFNIKIGAENSHDLQNMALVTAKYSMNGKEVGQVGVIGPERMNYKKVLSVLKHLGKFIDKISDNNKK